MPLSLPFPLLHGLLDAERNFDEVARRWPDALSVTALPSSPFDGQLVTYMADEPNGVAWLLRYDASRSSWMFVGGSPLMRAASGDMTNTNSTFTALTSGPTLTVPLAGDYKFEIFGSMTISADSVAQAGIFRSGVQSLTLTGQNGSVTVSGFARIDRAALSETLDVRCANATRVSTRYFNFRIGITPFQVS